MQNKKLDSVEIYPYIVVYKNLYKDIKKGYDLLKESTDNKDDNFFSKWEKWSHFGTYLSPACEGFELNQTRYAEVDKIATHTKKQEDQKQFLLEIMENFHIVTQDYASRFNVEVDYDKISTLADGGHTRTWRFSGPSICRYHIAASLDHEEDGGMHYHSDYVRERGHEPGYNFAITALSYFNDDYEGGEIDFVIGKKMLKYKPEAGDYVVFPSGHPDFLTEDGIVYLHGVMPNTGTHKYFSRMYLETHSEGSPEWFENEKKYGKEVWDSMQEKLRKQYRDLHPQRRTIEDGIRI
jgi:hypothetical protein